MNIRLIYIIFFIIILGIILFSINKNKREYFNDYSSHTKSSLDIYFPSEINDVDKIDCNNQKVCPGICNKEDERNKNKNQSFYEKFKKKIITALQYNDVQFVNNPKILIKANAKACNDNTSSLNSCSNAEINISLILSKILNNEIKTIEIVLNTNNIESSDNSTNGIFLAKFKTLELRNFGNIIFDEISKNPNANENTIMFKKRDLEGNEIGNDISIKDYFRDSMFLFNIASNNENQSTLFFNKLNEIDINSYFLIGTKGNIINTTYMRNINSEYNKTLNFIKNVLNANLINEVTESKDSYLYLGFRNKNGEIINNSNTTFFTEVLNDVGSELIGAQLHRMIANSRINNILLDQQAVELKYNKVGEKLDPPQMNININPNSLNNLRVQISSDSFPDKIINFSYNNQQSEVYLQNKDIQIGNLGYFKTSVELKTSNPMNFVLIPISKSNIENSYYIATAELPKALYLTNKGNGKLEMSLLKNEIKQRWQIKKVNEDPTDNKYTIKSIYTNEYLTCFPTGGYIDIVNRGRVYLDSNDEHIWIITGITINGSEIMDDNDLKDIQENFENRDFFVKEDKLIWNGYYTFDETNIEDKIKKFLKINLDDNGIGEAIIININESGNIDSITDDRWVLKANGKDNVMGKADKDGSWLTLNIVDPPLNNENGGITSERNNIRIQANVIGSDGLNNLANTEYSNLINGYIQKITNPADPILGTDWLEAQGMNITMDPSKGVGLPKMKLSGFDLSNYIKTYNNDGSCPCDKYCRWSGEVRYQVFSNRFNDKSPYHGWLGSKASLAEVVKKDKRGNIIEGSQKFLVPTEKYKTKPGEEYHCYCEKDDSTESRFVNSCGVACNDFNAATNCTTFIGQNISIQRPFGTLMNFTMNNNIENLKPTGGMTQIQIFEGNREYTILVDEETKKEYGLTPYCVTQNNWYFGKSLQWIFPGTFNSPWWGWFRTGVFYALNEETYRTLSAKEKSKYVAVSNYISWWPWRVMSFYNYEEPKFDKNCLGANVNIYFVYRITNFPIPFTLRAWFPVFFFWGGQSTNERIKRVVSWESRANGHELWVTVENTAGERKEFNVLKSDNWKFAMRNAYTVCANSDWWGRNNKATWSYYTFYVRNVDTKNLLKINRAAINTRNKYIFGIKKKSGYFNLAEAVKLSKALGCEIAPVNILDKLTLKTNYTFSSNNIRKWMVDKNNKTIVGLYNRKRFRGLRVLSNNNANLLCYGPIPLNLPNEFVLDGAAMDAVTGEIVKNPYSNGKFETSKIEYNQVPSNTSWNNAKKFCENKQMKLCSSKDYCPRGPGKQPVGGMRGSDQWAPVNNNDRNINNWISIGNFDPNNRLCKTHKESLRVNPRWGTTNKSWAFRGIVGCCPK
jgi:hypothetical protein